MMEINSFSGKYSFLSNMYLHKFTNEYGEIYDSSEHYFQSHKSYDPVENEQIRLVSTPKESKRLGRNCKLRFDWEDIKDFVMEDALKLKFSNEPLKSKLIATYPYKLIEGNTWNDTYWGVCNGIGSNKLGILLMKIRKELLKK